MDFIIAITERKPETALKIYDHISLKKDSEVYLVFLMSMAFMAINKLLDPNVAKLSGFYLKKELKLWFPEQEKLIPYYKNFGKSIELEKIQEAFDYIYSTDKLLKSSGGNRKTMMIALINNICSL
jgi:DNA polymerase III delta subunit